MVETEGSVMLNIYLPCYRTKVHELLLCRQKNIYSSLKGMTFITWELFLKMASSHEVFLGKKILSIESVSSKYVFKMSDARIL